MLEDGAGIGAVEVVALPDEDGSPAASPTHHVPGSPAHLRSRLEPPPGGPLSGVYTIVRRFEFSAEKQRNVVGAWRWLCGRSWAAAVRELHPPSPPLLPLLTPVLPALRFPRPQWCASPMAACT